MRVTLTASLIDLMDATTFFLTYAQSDLQHQQVYDALQSIKPVVWARVAREAHEDGNPHIHVIVRFGARVKTRSNARVFDIMGRHPNIQVVRRINDVLEYCAKDGNYQDFGPVPVSKDVYDILKQAAETGDREAFDRAAMGARVSFQWADHIWRQQTTADSTTLVEGGQGTECLQLQQLQFSGGSVAIIGPSGCGKSTWAKRVAPKPCLWVTHMDDLRKLKKSHKCIIFDDMDFNHLPRVAQIHIVDQDDVRSLHVRYGTVTIPANTPKIFTANTKPFLDDEAIKRRVKYYKIVSLAI